MLLIAWHIHSTVAGAVSLPAITSIIGMTCAGFDQCMPTTRSGFEIFACSLVMGIPEVLDAMTHLLPTKPSISLKTAALISSFSGTVSTTRSAPLQASAIVSVTVGNLPLLL